MSEFTKEELEEFSKKNEMILSLSFGELCQYVEENPKDSWGHDRLAHKYREMGNSAFVSYREDWEPYVRKAISHYRIALTIGFSGLPGGVNDTNFVREQIQELEQILKDGYKSGYG
jgi:hypothetical protein